MIIGISRNGGGALVAVPGRVMETYFIAGTPGEGRPDGRGKMSRGLSMIKRITNMHGGRVGFLSREGEESGPGICLPKCR